MVFAPVSACNCEVMGALHGSRLGRTPTYNSVRNSSKNELAQIYFWTGPVPFWTGPTEFEPALQKRHFFFTLSFMINNIVLFANECLECSWLPWQHVEIMNTPSIAQLGTQSHWSDALPPVAPTPAPSPEGCTNSDGPSDWVTDHCPMLFVHGRMVRHRSNGLSMSQVSVSDMDPPGPDLLPQTPWPTHAPDPHPPISTHRPQPLQVRQTGGIT